MNASQILQDLIAQSGIPAEAMSVENGTTTIKMPEAK